MTRQEAVGSHNTSAYHTRSRRWASSALKRLDPGTLAGKILGRRLVYPHNALSRLFLTCRRQKIVSTSTYGCQSVAKIFRRKISSAGIHTWWRSSIWLSNGYILASRERLILVSINYRLGALGFVYSGAGPDDLVDNQGFWDQREALLWIKSNIEAFGGDPMFITVMGQSAGAWSVSALLTSPQTYGMFQSAIMMSGSLLSDAQLCPRLARAGT